MKESHSDWDLFATTFCGLLTTWDGHLERIGLDLTRDFDKPTLLILDDVQTIYDQEGASGLFERLCKNPPRNLYTVFCAVYANPSVGSSPIAFSNVERIPFTQLLLTQPEANDMYDAYMRSLQERSDIPKTLSDPDVKQLILEQATFAPDQIHVGAILCPLRSLARILMCRSQHVTAKRVLYEYQSRDFPAQMDRLFSPLRHVNASQDDARILKLLREQRTGRLTISQDVFQPQEVVQYLLRCGLLVKTDCTDPKYVDLTVLSALHERIYCHHVFGQQDVLPPATPFELVTNVIHELSADTIRSQLQNAEGQAEPNGLVKEAAYQQMFFAAFKRVLPVTMYFRSEQTVAPTQGEWNGCRVVVHLLLMAFL